MGVAVAMRCLYPVFVVAIFGAWVFLNAKPVEGNLAATVLPCALQALSILTASLLAGLMFPKGRRIVAPAAVLFALFYFAADIGSWVHVSGEIPDFPLLSYLGNASLSLCVVALSGYFLAGRVHQVSGRVRIRRQATAQETVRNEE
ncbi:MAG: hypothetical protein JW741_00865 [Sedimentisphaerales bacterium]|nr:hypothetical protein [Sedimentisphaerales bacterium]